MADFQALSLELLLLGLEFESMLRRPLVVVMQQMQLELSGIRVRPDVPVDAWTISAKWSYRL
jgi:hypothetical protein